MKGSKRRGGLVMFLDEADILLALALAILSEGIVPVLYSSPSPDSLPERLSLF